MTILEKRWKRSAADNVITAFTVGGANRTAGSASRGCVGLNDARFDSVARHGSHRHCRVDGWLAEKVQTQLGILVVPIQQPAVDRVGLARSRLRTHRSPALPCIPKHPRRNEESHLGDEACLLI